MSYLNVYRNEVERCERFLATLTEYEKLEGADENTKQLREQWTAELQIWQFGYNALLEEMNK